MQTADEQKKQKSSLLECLTLLKTELLALQAEFPNIPPALPANQDNASQNGDNAVAPAANNPSRSFADQYFQHAVARYLELIALVEPIVADPIKNRSLIMSLSPESEFVQMLLEKCISAGTLGLPHLLHPRLNPETKSVYYEGDDRCYRLAQVIRNQLSFVLKADLGLIINLLNLLNIATPFIKDGLRYLLSVIQGRIERFEHNQRYQTTLNHYINNVKPMLQETISYLQAEAWESDELAELLESLTQIAEQACQRQAVIPLFLRDNPLYQHNDEDFKYYDRYPHLLQKFLRADREFCQTAETHYAQCPLAVNIELGFETGALLDTLIDVVEVKQTSALSECVLAFNAFKEKVLILRKRNDELKTNNEMLNEDVPEWSSAVCYQLNLLIKQLKTYSDYNPEAMHLRITTSQAQLHDKSKFCRHLYHELLKLKRQVDLQPELSGHVCVTTMRDLLAQTTPLIMDTKKILEAKGLTDNNDFRAIVDYLKATQEYHSLFNDLATNLQAVVIQNPLPHSNNLLVKN